MGIELNVLIFLHVIPFQMYIILYAITSRSKSVSGMDVASVSFSRPYFVNAPLVADANNSNLQEVENNLSWSSSLLDALLGTVPEMFVEEHSVEYYRRN